MSRKAPTSEEIVEIRRLLKLRLAQQSISQSAYLWEKEFWNAYIWLSKELTNTEKWLGSVLFFLTEKGRKLRRQKICALELVLADPYP